MEPIGTWAWTQATGGKLSRADVGRFIAMGVQSQMRLIPGRIAAGLGLRRDRLAHLDVDALRLPDSAAAREAEELCAETPLFLANHARRSFLWTAALAQHDGLKFDEEVAYVGALLHDVGLVPAVHAGDTTCFTLRSAQAALEVTSRAGWEPTRSEAVADAISLHLNPMVNASQGLEAHLMQAGIALDVAGMRRWQIDASTFEAVVARHPRVDFKKDVRKTFGEHGAAAPMCRVDVLNRFAGLGLMIRIAPFAE